MLDYGKLGLKVGLEIHRRLDTKKLFCNCSSSMKSLPSKEVSRTLTAVAGELEEIDPAALHEKQRDRKFLYTIYPGETCLVELDDEPPHDCNKEALKISLEISLLTKANIPNEIHFMRKTVVDGSNTSGFQRTAIVGLDGLLNASFGNVRIDTLALEEESAQILRTENNGNIVSYGLNRLGIPLIEIGTAPDMHSPQQAREVAEAIGNLLKSTGKVQRGIGTIRQDINVSIAGGNRVEIKGAQDLRMIETIVELETLRQKNLIEIKQELATREKALKRKYAGNCEIVDLTNIFTKSESKVIKNALSKKDGTILGTKLELFSGLLKKEVQPNRRIGTELSDYAKTQGVGGLFHSDELPNYGIAENEVQEIKKNLGCNENDAFILVADSEPIARKAIKAAIQRAKTIATIGVEKEVRKVNADGTTSYMRPLPGAARMYPETDILPIIADEKIISEIRKNLPESFQKKAEKYQKHFGLNKEIANQLIHLDYWNWFEEIASEVKIDPQIIANLLVHTLPDLKTRDNTNIDKITKDDLIDCLELLKNGKITKDTIPVILKNIVRENISADKVVERHKLEKISDKEALEAIKQIISSQEDKNKKAILQKSMDALRGRLENRRIVELVEEELKHGDN